jgi:hypothetical protein
MISFIRQYAVLIGAVVVLAWFVVRHIVADLPDDVLTQAYRRIKQKGASNGGVRDNR